MTPAQLRARHFERLKGYGHSREYAEYTGAAAEGLPSLIGDRWEIDEEIYRQFLEVLPPLNWRGDTFYLSEFTFGDITTKYTREGGRYYCEFARWPERHEAPTHTPWGYPDTITEIAPGIVSYSTPSHGGIWLSPERVAEMPPPLQAFVPFGGPQPRPGRWFEEDCDWSIVALAFPQFFSADDQGAALLTIQHYKPELFGQVLSLLEQQGKHVYSIHYADREMAHEQNDPTLGLVVAGSKAEAEALAEHDRDVLRRRVPCASLSAVEVKGQREELER